MGVVPRVQSKLSGALHAHCGKKLLQDLQTQESMALNRAMVKFTGMREKDAMAFVECLGVSQKDTMEGPPWRETLGRSLGSHDAAELVGGMCYGNGYRHETTRLYAISVQRRDGARSLTIVCFTRHWLDSFARVKSSWLLKIHGPSEREN